jgi:hypothetical protein
MYILTIKQNSIFQLFHGKIRMVLETRWKKVEKTPRKFIPGYWYCTSLAWSGGQEVERVRKGKKLMASPGRCTAVRQLVASWW